MITITLYCSTNEDYLCHFAFPDSDTEKKPTQALQLGFELALKERDAVLRENAKAIEERDQAVRRAQILQTERDKALASLENLASKKNT